MESFITHGVLFTGVCDSSFALLVSFRASLAKADEIADNTAWYGPALSRFENKLRRKQVGGARFSYLQFIKEMTIIAIAKMIEDLFFDLLHLFHIELDFWRPGLDLRFHNEVKCIRQLNNSLKHSHGVILDDDHPSNRALIDECGYPPNSEVNWLDLNLEDMIAKAFIFQVDLICQITGHEFPDELSLETGDLASVVTGFLIPDHLRH